MYIISKNKDYYDGVVGSVGMDKTIVYERYPDETNNRDLMPKEFQGSFRLDENPFLNICHIDVDIIIVKHLLLVFVVSYMLDGCFIIK